MPCDRKIGPYPCCSVVQGDCLELMKSLPDGCVDAVITDPPYVGREDLFATDGVESAIETLVGKVKSAFVFWPCIAPPPRTPDAAHVWHKAVPIHPSSETGNVAGHHYERILGYGTGKRCEVFRVAAIIPGFAACADELVKHPTQKPLALLLDLVDRTDADTILDPFSGSGTTLVAAKKLGRHFLGFEISEQYCEIARKRLALVEAQPTLFQPKPEQGELGL